MCHLYKSGLSYSTVNCYLSGLSFYHKLNDWEDNTQRFVVRKLTEGLKRSSHKVDTRSPITRDILQKILHLLPTICVSNFEARLFAAVFSLAFHGLFRVGELTVSGNYSVQHTVCISNVRFIDTYLEITLSKFKN